MVGISPSGVNAVSTTSQYVRGWSFTANHAISVKALGFFDMGRDGLALSHTVGIYNATTQSLVLSAVIPAGQAAPLDGYFRTVSTGSPQTLVAGNYVIAATMGAERYTNNPVSTVVNPLITFGQDRSLLSASLAFPTGTSQTVGFGHFGPNFQATQTPEPGTLVALGFGAVLLRLRRRGRKPTS